MCFLLLTGCTVNNPESCFRLCLEYECTNTTEITTGVILKNTYIVATEECEKYCFEECKPHFTSATPTSPKGEGT